MKKTLVVLLILAVAGGIAFGEASLKLDLSFNNVGGGLNDDAITPDELVTKLGLIFAGSGSQELGPGSLSFGLQVSPALYFSDKAGTGADAGGDDNFGDIGYSLAAGPGTLGFGLKLFIHNAGTGHTWEPRVEYTGLPAGPVTLGFGAFYDFKTDGNDTNGKAGPFAKATDDGDDDVGLWVDAKFDFGLYIKYKFVYGIGAKNIKNIAYLDINYALLDGKLVVGLELDNTANGRDEKNIFTGFLVKPYASYTITDNISVGAYFKIGNIAGDEAQDGKDLFLTPGVWFKYSL